MEMEKPKEQERAKKGKSKAKKSQNFQAYDECSPFRNEEDESKHYSKSYEEA
jgi:hypothetical protein